MVVKSRSTNEVVNEWDAKLIRDACFVCVDYLCAANEDEKTMLKGSVAIDTLMAVLQTTQTLKCDDVLRLISVIQATTEPLEADKTLTHQSSVQLRSETAGKVSLTDFICYYGSESTDRGDRRLLPSNTNRRAGAE